MSLQRLLARLGNLSKRAQINEELAEEIDAHMEMEHEEQVVAGHTPDRARGEALRAFGNVTLSRELGLSRLMAGVLFGVGPLDGWAFLASSLVLASIGFAACYIPARRAMRVDPLIALRYE